MVRRYSKKSITRKIKVRAKLKRFSDRPRLSVFRSNKYIYSQIIDDQKGETLVMVNEKDLKKLKIKDEKLKTNFNKAFAVGEALAKKALKKKIKQVYFDRGSCKYHGRIKALAQGARKGGLEF